MSDVAATATKVEKNSRNLCLNSLDSIEESTPSGIVPGSESGYTASSRFFETAWIMMV